MPPVSDALPKQNRGHLTFTFHTTTGEQNNLRTAEVQSGERVFFKSRHRKENKEAEEMIVGKLVRDTPEGKLFLAQTRRTTLLSIQGS